MLPILISLLITVSAYIFIGIYYLGTSRWPNTYQNKKVLFVTAHPDDECMFFGPTIRFFKHTGHVFLICMTNGNYDGLGEERGDELIQSSKRLGLDPANVKLVDSKILTDGPEEDWSETDVSAEVVKYANEIKPDIIVTFDEYGVSGHVNHIATSRGVKYAFDKQLLPENTRLYQLKSVNFFRKYSSFVDCFISSTSMVYNIGSFKDIVNIQSAMKCHKTQLSWFRKLYVMFSRYMVVNTLQSVL